MPQSPRSPHPQLKPCSCPSAPAATRFLSKQTQAGGGGDGGGQCLGNPGNKPQTLAAARPATTPARSRSGPAKGCEAEIPVLEPRWWEAVAGTGPAGGKQRRSGPQSLRGPKPAAIRTLAVATRRPHSSPTRGGGSRSNKEGPGRGGATGLDGSRPGVSRWSSAMGPAWGTSVPSANHGWSPQRERSFPPPPQGPIHTENVAESGRERRLTPAQGSLVSLRPARHIHL